MRYGITSSGDGDCKVYGRNMRIERFATFIRNFTRAYSLHAGPSTVESQGCAIAARPAAPAGSASWLLLALAGGLVALARRLAAIRATPPARS